MEYIKSIFKYFIGGKMKRYVKELALAEMKNCSVARKEKIEKAVNMCERGYITDFEAVKLIVDSYYED